MTMTAERHPTEQYIRSAMTAARNISGRELTFTENGIVVTDPLGDKHGFTTEAPRPSASEILAMLPNKARGFYYSSSDHVEFPGLGSWKLKDRAIPVIKPEKQRFAALEALFTADPDDLAKLRSLYDFPDTDIFISCEGDTRSRDVAIAFATELNLTGHNAKLGIAPESSDWSYDGKHDKSYEGTILFSPVAKRLKQSWDITHRKSEYGYPGNEQSKVPATPGTSRIVVLESARMAYHFRNADQRGFNMPDRRQVIVGIEIIRSTPTAKIIFSEKAAADCSTRKTPENAPWTRHNERKAARLKARPPAPRTWHQTTQDVADAFVARIAPRGFVSGKALYFHGPVAYSLYDRNPVAALVDLPDGRTLMFNGRAPGQGGTLAGTVTSASGDIDNSARDTPILRFNVGDLLNLITIGGIPLDVFAWRAGREKNEHAYPRTCSVDLEKLDTYIAARREAALESLDEAFQTSMPTYKKANAYGFLAGVARFRDTMAELFNIDLPDVGNAAEYAALETDMSRKARARQVSLDEKRKAEAQPAPAAPFFQIRPGA
jgi:hypothetical protein